MWIGAAKFGDNVEQCGAHIGAASMTQGARILLTAAQQPRTGSRIVLAMTTYASVGRHG